MFYLVVAIFVLSLVIMNRKGVIGEREFLCALVFALFGVAGYMGLN